MLVQLALSLARDGLGVAEQPATLRGQVQRQLGEEAQPVPAFAVRERQAGASGRQHACITVGQLANMYNWVLSSPEEAPLIVSCSELEECSDLAKVIVRSNNHCQLWGLTIGDESFLPRAR